MAEPPQNDVANAMSQQPLAPVTVQNLSATGRLDVNNMQFQPNGNGSFRWRMGDVRFCEESSRRRRNGCPTTPWWAWVLLAIGGVFLLWLLLSNVDFQWKNSTGSTTTNSAPTTVVVPQKTTDDVYNAVQDVKSDLRDHRREATSYATNASRERTDIKNRVEYNIAQVQNLDTNVTGFRNEFKTYASQQVNAWQTRLDSIFSLINAGNGNVDSLRREWKVNWDSLSAWRSRLAQTQSRSVDRDN